MNTTQQQKIQGLTVGELELIKICYLNPTMPIYLACKQLEIAEVEYSKIWDCIYDKLEVPKSFRTKQTVYNILLNTNDDGVKTLGGLYVSTRVTTFHIGIYDTDGNYIGMVPYDFAFESDALQAIEDIGEYLLSFYVGYDKNARLGVKSTDTIYY